MKGFQFIRNFTTSTTDLGKRNLRKFHLGKFRGTKQFRKDQRLGKFPDIPVYGWILFSLGRGDLKCRRKPNTTV